MLLSAALLWRRWRIGPALTLAALVVLLVFGSFPVSHALLWSLEKQYPDHTTDDVSPAEAIVVLGGAVHPPSRQHPGSGLVDSSDRVLHAFRLYRGGRAPLILCSGGGEQGAEAPVMSRLLEEWGVPEGSILMEDRSLNTRENALFSYSVLHARGVRRILLVTSAIHMPRAAGAFRKAGFEVVPAAADYHTGWGGEAPFWSPSVWLPSPGGLGWSERALQEWLGLLVYRMRGWA